MCGTLFQSDPWLCQDLGPLEMAPFLTEQDNAGLCFQKESGHDGCLQDGLGYLVQQQYSLWLMGDYLDELAH